jgi:uncharacterized protein with HEPN domain
MRLPKHLFDALTAARRALTFVEGFDEAGYADNVLVRSAVERQLEVLGEACRRALDEAPSLRERIPDSALAVALRNRIIHDYDRLENAIVFDTVRRDLPLMIVAIESELRALDGEAGGDGGPSAG